MALSDPRLTADFADLLKVKSIVWDVQRNDQVDGQGSGDLLLTEMASPLWAPRITVDWMPYAEARKIEAKLNSLTALRQLYLCDPIAKAPALDPTGSILGASTVLLASIGGNNRSVTFSGLPAAYKLTEGDLWHIDFSTSPVRRGLFQVTEAVTASGAGVTPLFEVFPNIWPGIVTGTAVKLINPALKAAILPGSITRAARTGTKADGMAFTAIQRL